MPLHSPLPRPAVPPEPDGGAAPTPRGAFSWRDAPALLGGAVVYFIVGRLCILLASLHGNISPVWPATGLAIGVLIWRGPRMWPAIAAGQFLLSFHSSSLPLAVALGMAAGNVGEAWLVG